MTAMPHLVIQVEAKAPLMKQLFYVTKLTKLSCIHMYTLGARCCLLMRTVVILATSLRPFFHCVSKQQIVPTVCAVAFAWSKSTDCPLLHKQQVAANAARVVRCSQCWHVCCLCTNALLGKSHRPFLQQERQEVTKQMIGHNMVMLAQTRF